MLTQFSSFGYSCSSHTSTFSGAGSIGFSPMFQACRGLGYIREITCAFPDAKWCSAVVGGRRAVTDGSSSPDVKGRASTRRTTRAVALLSLLVLRCWGHAAIGNATWASARQTPERGCNRRRPQADQRGHIIASAADTSMQAATRRHLRVQPGAVPGSEPRCVPRGREAFGCRQHANLPACRCSREDLNTLPAADMALCQGQGGHAR